VFHNNIIFYLIIIACVVCWRIIFKDPSLERLVRRLTANCYLRVTTWLGGLLLGRHK
jgi:hypothetical protein